MAKCALARPSRIVRWIIFCANSTHRSRRIHRRCHIVCCAWMQPAPDIRLRRCVRMFRKSIVIIKCSHIRTEKRIWLATTVIACIGELKLNGFCGTPNLSEGYGNGDRRKFVLLLDATLFVPFEIHENGRRRRCPHNTYTEVSSRRQYPFCIDMALERRAASSFGMVYLARLNVSRLIYAQTLKLTRLAMQRNVCTSPNLLRRSKMEFIAATLHLGVCVHRNSVDVCASAWCMVCRLGVFVCAFRRSTLSVMNDWHVMFWSAPSEKAVIFRIKIMQTVRWCVHCGDARETNDGYGTVSLCSIPSAANHFHLH